MGAAKSKKQNKRDLNLEIQEEISKYFNNPRQNYILTPDEIKVNDEVLLYFILDEHERLAPNYEIKDARFIETIANIFSKIRNMNVSESTEQSWTNESSIFCETFKCLIVYLINLSHNENYSIKKSSNRFLEIFEDLINFYHSEKETTTRPKTTLNSSEIIFLFWLLTIAVSKLFKKYKEFDFKSYKDCSQVGKLAIVCYKHLQGLYEWYKDYRMKYTKSRQEEKKRNKEREIEYFYYQKINENIERICEKNALLYIERENLPPKEPIRSLRDYFKRQLAYSFYKQAMDILSTKNLKDNDQYKYDFISELWYPEVILKAIEDYYKKSEPEDFETSLEDFLQICPIFEFLCQDELKELFPQSKELAGVLKEINKNAISNDKQCRYLWLGTEMKLTTDIIHKTYDIICPNHKTSSIEDISYHFPRDIDSLFEPFYNKLRKESMTNEECKKFFETIFREGKKYSSQEGELLHILLYFDWDSSLIKNYHKKICEVFEHYANSIMKIESLVAYYCVLRKKVSDDNLKILSDLMKSRWKAEKTFLEFLLESTVLTDVEIDFTKIEDDIKKFSVVFFLAFSKILLFFSRQDFFDRELRINQEKCIEIFVRTLEHFPSLKKILVNTEEKYWFPTLSKEGLFTFSAAILQLIWQYESIPYERLEPVFKGYWLGVFTIKGNLQIEHCEKSSLSEIKILGKGGFGEAKLVNTKNSPIPQVAKYFGKVKPKDIRKEVVTLLMLQENQHVVALYGFITENFNLVGLLMEYCEGGSLEKKIESTDVYGEDEIILWTSQAAAGLLFLHENKIIHRDIKPANLLLDKNHSILKVADVGISKPPIDLKHNMKDAYFYGTPGYAAPEAETKEATYLVDVYSLGRTIWHMIYREYPSNDKVKKSIADENKTEYPRAIAVSSELIGFHIRMMEDNKEMRPTMQKVYDYFSSFLDRNTTEHLNKMKAEGTRKAFTRFREDALKQRGNNTIIDQDERIKNVVDYMDAEMVFKMVSITGSTVQFSNGEKLDLCFNDQLDIHPRAINQMNQIRKNNKSDLQNMLELTKKYMTSQITGETEYLENIKACLRPYEMITRMEIDKVKEMISQMSGPLAEHYKKNLDRSEAYRLRTVLEGAPKDGLQLAHRLTIGYDGTSQDSDISTNTLAAWVEIVKLECHDFKMPDPVAETPQKRIKYYREQLIPDEIAGMIKEEMSESEATDRANENFVKREAIEQARMRMNQNEITLEELKNVIKNNEVQDNNLMRKYHRRTFQEWAAGGTKEELFFRQFNDNFNDKLETYRSEIDRINEFVKSEELTFPNPVVAYYHVRKHGRDSRKYFVNTHNWDIPSDTEEYNYFITEKNFIFSNDYKQKTEIYVSQDATKTSTFYRDGSGYFGVTKCDYNAALGEPCGTQVVVTHKCRGFKMMEANKNSFITKIAALLASSDSVSGADVLSEAFVFFRNCNQSSINPIPLFTLEERKKIEQQIIKAIPLLDRDIRTRVNTLGQESAMRIRSIRSGLEFIRDNFGPKNAYLEYEFENLMFDKEVKRLDQTLDRWKEERGQYDFGNDPVDLRGVPESHSWWSKLERDDSIRVFGTK